MRLRSKGNWVFKNESILLCKKKRELSLDKGKRERKEKKNKKEK